MVTPQVCVTENTQAHKIHPNTSISDFHFIITIIIINQAFRTLYHMTKITYHSVYTAAKYKNTYNDTIKSSELS